MKSPHISSNASIFADRGDPWVTPREGREKFGRNLLSEVPEVDALLFAGRAKKFEQPMVVKAKPAPNRPVDQHRLLVSKILSCKRRISRPISETVAHDTGLAKVEGAKHG